MTKLRVLDLFSGIGGFSLGLERTGGFETAAFCEYEKFPRQVLAKHWPDVPCFPDVRKLKGEDVGGSIDVICGGYPCQPFSTAGKRRGQEDDRHLWPEFSRLVAELRPAWVIGENVAGHISMGIDDVLSDLEGQGYAARPFVIPACSVDAPHRRDRVWTVAHATQLQRDGSAEYRQQGQRQVQQSGKRGRAQLMADASGVNAQGQQSSSADTQKRAQPRERSIGSRRYGVGRGRPEPGMGGMADGLPAGMDGPCRWLGEPDISRVAKGVKGRANRLKALGNAVVPQIPEMIGRAILQVEGAK